MCPSAFAYVASQPFAYRHIGGLLMSERRPLGSNAENLTEESMTSERVLRLASIVAFALALFPLPLVSIDTSTAAVFRRRSVRA